jgi:hypothetical protein
MIDEAFKVVLVPEIFPEFSILFVAVKVVKEVEVI